MFSRPLQAETHVRENLEGKTRPEELGLVPYEDALNEVVLVMKGEEKKEKGAGGPERYDVVFITGVADREELKLKNVVRGGLGEVGVENTAVELPVVPAFHAGDGGVDFGASGRREDEDILCPPQLPGEGGGDFGVVGVEVGHLDAVRELPLVQSVVFGLLHSANPPCI